MLLAVAAAVTIASVTAVHAAAAAAAAAVIGAVGVIGMGCNTYSIVPYSMCDTVPQANASL